MHLSDVPCTCPCKVKCGLAVNPTAAFVNPTAAFVSSGKKELLPRMLNTTYHVWDKIFRF